jgi:hypothetical protein
VFLNYLFYVNGIQDVLINQEAAGDNEICAALEAIPARGC